jgi:hypothetical protein
VPAGNEVVVIVTAEVLGLFLADCFSELASAGSIEQPVENIRA